MEYANKNQIPFVIIIGESELQNGTFVLKNMLSGTQEVYKTSEVNTIVWQ